MATFNYVRLGSRVGVIQNGRTNRRWFSPEDIKPVKDTERGVMILEALNNGSYSATINPLTDTVVLDGTTIAAGGTLDALETALVGSSVFLKPSPGGGGGSFATITGQPTDNANLSAVLDGKADVFDTEDFDPSLYATKEFVMALILGPSILKDGNTIGWYKYDETGGITKDVNNKVTQWNDSLNSGRNLACSDVADFTPTWSSTGILFDGLYNYLKATFTLVQPEFIYMVVKVFADTPSGGSIFYGEANNGGLKAGTPTTKLVIGASTTFDNNNGVVDTFCIIRTLFNGASSKSVVNATTPVVGNAGTQSMDGFMLGSSVGVGYGGDHSHIEVKEVIVRKVADNTTNETAIYNYLKAKYSL